MDNSNTDSVDVISTSTETTTTLSNSKRNNIKYGVLFAVCLILLIGAIILWVLIGTNTIYSQSEDEISSATYYKNSKIGDGGIFIFLVILAGFATGFGLLGIIKIGPDVLNIAREKYKTKKKNE